MLQELQSKIRPSHVEYCPRKLCMSQNTQGLNILTENSPHTSTYSFSVSACNYYFDHFCCTSPDSIYTIDIPPRIRKLHNHFLYAIPFKLLLFIYLSCFLLKSDKCGPTNLLAIHDSKFSLRHLFYNCSLPHS